MECNNYSVVMMCTTETIYGVKKNYRFICEYLKPKSVIIVASKKVKDIIDKEQIDVQFIDEDQLYPKMNMKSIKDIIISRANENVASRRAGWYFQQFLKMAYCIICEDDEYLIWDSDTVPTHYVNFLSEDGKKIFHTKTEYHKPYFDTMRNLFPMLKKNNDYSFISEHMLIDKKIMLEIINTIELNLDIEGDLFWEKILHVIEQKHLGESGFSEFETYGTYVEYFYREKYETRKWESLREGTVFYKHGVDEKVLEYLSRKYDAISFEQHDIHIKLQKLLSYRLFQNLFVMNMFQKVKGVLAERNK